MNKHLSTAWTRTLTSGMLFCWHCGSPVQGQHESHLHFTSLHFTSLHFMSTSGLHILSWVHLVDPHKTQRGRPLKDRREMHPFSMISPDPCQSPPTPPPPSKPQKSGFQVGGVWGGSGPKTHWGMCLLDKIMILQGVKLTIQPLGVGYANRPKQAQNGGVCGVFPYIRLPSFDLTTSAR